MRGENQSLQETLAMSEMSLDRASEERAQIMGHANPKQKIRHMVNLKEENKELREQLKKADFKAYFKHICLNISNIYIYYTL